MSWYRLHRPRQVSDLHLVNVREKLQKYMSEGKLPQVFLFAGPKGTGKTSSARIIGALLNDERNAAMVDYQFFGGPQPKKAIYQEPDAQNEFNQKIFTGQSYVVQELDAASNRGIDDVRALKERVNVPPQHGKMTVYILDEAHMLTTEAFNALLKLLEEPPAHAVFILATTEFHKIPETIASRATLLQFRKATIQELEAAMQSVLDKEKATVTPELLQHIAKQADGSFRDAVKLLENSVSQGDSAAEKTTELGFQVENSVVELLDSIMNKNETAAAKLFESLRSVNSDDSYFFKSFLHKLHYALLQNLGVHTGEPIVNKNVAQFLLKELSQVSMSNAPISFLPLELKVLELIERAKSKQGSTSPSSTPSPSNGGSSSEPTVQIAQESATEHNNPGDSKQLITKWAELLAAVKSKNVTLEALLRSAKPVEGSRDTATVAVYYKFHKEQLEHPKFSSVIDECVIPLAGGRVQLRYVLNYLPVEAELVEHTDSVVDLTSLAEEALI